MFQKKIQRAALTLFPPGRSCYGRIPTLPEQLIGWLGVLLHKLNILHVQWRGEPDGVRQEDEEDTGDNGHDERE